MTWLDARKLDGFVEEALSILAKNEALTARLPFIKASLKWRVGRMINIAEWS